MSFMGGGAFRYHTKQNIIISELFYYILISCAFVKASQENFSCRPVNLNVFSVFFWPQTTNRHVPQLED